MPKKRKAKNKGLPTRWRLIHGAYYFRVPPGHEASWDENKQFRLGKSLPEAYKVWAERLGTLDDAKTIGDLLDRHSLEVVPKKEVATQAQNAARSCAR